MVGGRLPGGGRRERGPPDAYDPCTPICECSVETLPAVRREIVVLRMAGEFDLCTEGSLQSALAGCLDPRPRYLVVDLSAVTFCAVRGLTLLADAADSAAAGITRFAVSGASAQLGRVANLVWEPGFPTRYRSIAAAATAIRAEQAQHIDVPPG